MKYKLLLFSKQTLIIFILVGLLFTGCSKQHSKKAWGIEDFYVYNSDGEIVNYPNNEELTYWDNVEGLNRSYEKSGGTANLNYYTNRGVNIHSVAKMAFSEYDLSGFYYTLTKWPILGSLNESEKEIRDSFFEKYPDLNEAVKHTNEISGNLALFLSAEFQVDQNENVIQLILDEKGNYVNYDSSMDTYEITFYIRDDNVFEWSIAHRSGQK